MHTLEHGRVIIWFKPSLPESQRANLKALFDEDTYQLVLTPRSDMPSAIAASAWNREPGRARHRRACSAARATTRRCIDALRTFRDEHRSTDRNRSPSVPLCFQGVAGAHGPGLHAGRDRDRLRARRRDRVELGRAAQAVDRPQHP